MSKIKRAFTVEQETKRLRLMQSINEVSLSEAGVMDTIKKGVAAVADKASSWAKGSNTPAPSATPAPAQAEDPDEKLDTFQTGSATSRDLTAIATQVMQPGSGSVRFVLSMTHPDLKKYYLKSGGGADAAEMILAVSQDKDNAFTNLAKNIKTNKIGRFVEIEGAHPSMVKTFNAAPKLNMMVLLNVPEVVAKEFVLAADENAAKEAFIKMMSHKFYVGTLNRTKMGTDGADALDKAASNDEEMVKQFDPHWLEHWRDNSMRVRAIDQWDNVHSDDAKDKQAQQEVDKLTSKAKRAEDERKALDSLDKSAMGKNEAAIKSIISSATDVDAMATAFTGSISSGKFTRDEVVAAVTKMNQVLQSKTLEQLLQKLQVTPPPAATPSKRRNRP